MLCVPRKGCTLFLLQPRSRSPAARLCAVIVKASSGPRYVVGCRAKVDKAKLTPNTRVTLDMTTLTIMRALPREVPTPTQCMAQFLVGWKMHLAIVPCLQEQCATEKSNQGKFSYNHSGPPILLSAGRRDDVLNHDVLTLLRS